MDKLQPGYVFETVFWAQRPEDGRPRLVARNVNGATAPLPILCDDRRVLPGKRVKVKVEQLAGDAVHVSFLGLVGFDLQRDVYVDPVLLKQFEILLCSGRSILLEGPQGTGKTTVSRELARSLGMEYVFFNCSVCFEPADFVGSLQLLIDDQGRTRTEWLPTEVLRAVYEANEQPLRRYLVFLDELNRCRSYALNGIMSAIDSTRRIFDPRRNHYVPIPDNVQWIAAVNSGKQFTGTYKLDLAQLDRFAVLKIDYPPEEQEVKILQARYDMVKPRLVKKVVHLANLIRRDEAITTDLSMRATDEACLFLSYPTLQRQASKDDLVAILRTSFCNRLAGSVDEEGSEAHAAFRLIERHVLLPAAATREEDAP
jgi:nitric oxide reductase NorQ protein